MKPLRVALVRQRYNPYGGAERFVARAMRALAAQGAQVTLVTRRWPKDAGFEALLCDPPYAGSLWRDRGFARAACRALARGGFDLVQSHERIACCDVYRAGDGVHREWLVQRARVQGPLARLSVTLNPYHRYVLAAERELFASPRLKAVICNSQMVRDEIVFHFGLPEDRLHVIYSGVDTRHFHPGLRAEHRPALRSRLGIPEGAPLALFVGSGFERKGLPALLAAVARVPGMHLAVVGADKRAAAMGRLAGRLGIAERVRLTGGQPDVRPFYGAADGFALPTLYDPFPNAALEALACGLPVLTSNKSGAAELVQEGVSGFVRDALDVAGIAEALERMADAPAMGEAARAAVEDLTLEAMAQRLLALYGALIGREAAAPVAPGPERGSVSAAC